MPPNKVPPKVANLLACLDQQDLRYTLHHHPPVFTVSEARNLRGLIPGAHSKNLFLKDKKGNLFLVSALEDATIDLKSLHKCIQAASRLSFASAELLLETLGIVPGAVSPLGAMNDRDCRCKIVLDKAFFSYPTLNFHPLDNSMTISVEPTSLIAFLESTGHAPQIVAFDDMA